MPENGKVIVGCSHGEENPDSVVVSYLTAGAALDLGPDGPSDAAETPVHP